MNHPSCKVCAGVWPRQDHFIADCGLTRAYLHDDQFFPGWTLLVLQYHATDVFDLSRNEGSNLIEEVSAVAGVLAKEWRAVKINYELLGKPTPPYPLAPDTTPSPRRGPARAAVGASRTTGSTHAGRAHPCG